ncbi:MAG: hypothetical protein H0T80_11940, partial [Betaproteobacteria bacterium]|nr:hypothetical protein [Betaproteobacteria bacterium]
MNTRRTRPRQIAEHRAQWMPGTHFVVPVREDNQRRQARNATAEELDEVERRFIGPVDVLEHRDHRRAALTEIPQHRGKQPMTIGLG